MTKTQRIKDLEQKVVMLIAEQSFILNNKPHFKIGDEIKGLKVISININHDWINYVHENPYYEYTCSCNGCQRTQRYSGEWLVGLKGGKN